MEQYNKSFVYFISLVSAMGGLLFGYDWVVIGGAKPFYEVYFNIVNSPFLQGWAMSVALLGCLIGASLAGMMADKYGRKKLLILSAFIFFVSSYITGAASSFTIFLIARFLGGIGIGIASNLSPMYIAEVAPFKIRGKLVSLNQLTIVLGILGAQIANWLIAEKVPLGFTSAQILESWNGQMGWRWMFWGAAFPAAAFFILMFLIPESPRWLSMKGRIEQAVSILGKIGGKEYAKSEFSSMMEASARTEKGSLKMLLSHPFRKVLIIGLVIAVFQQWCGTNVIFNYAQEIFQSAGFTLDDVLFNIVVTGVANLVFTFVAIYTVDKLGRRALMMIGAGGLAGIYLILGTCYFFHVSGWFMVVLVVMAIACYAMSLGPVTWVILSEIFPNHVRGVAMAVATFALWIGCFTLTYTFPLLNTFLGSSGTFWIYSLICASGFLFIFFKLPETKGKSLEDLEKELIQ
ncbi:sugar porter family MFS transporter [uncultured Bacteroides sp.]|uniref:sugar porter family MFS transporter n=1 Tax=uncultured Bacteroides sp. TaxID=162156 RepID=UPI002AA8BB00|nr:sugar porter family MFS transporter [uncultured Bacteroides sp.]